jgi:hypothetical protein
MSFKVLDILVEHLAETVVELTKDCIGGALLGSLVTWMTLREPLPSLDEAHTGDDAGQRLPLSDRMVMKMDRAIRKAIEISMLVAIIGFTAMKGSATLKQLLDNDKRFWPAVESNAATAVMTVTGGKGGRFRY